MAPLDNIVRSEDPVPDRHLCIHETPHKPNHQCSYPCPYRNTTFRMDLPQSTPQDAAVFCYELMNFTNISSDLPDIMTTTSDNDIPDLEDILASEHLDNIQHVTWFALTFYLTPPKITNTQDYIYIYIYVCVCVCIKHGMNIVYSIKPRC